MRGWNDGTRDDERHTILEEQYPRLISPNENGINSSLASDAVEEKSICGEPLFRPEAYSARLNSTIGTPVTGLPVSWTVLTVSLLTLFAAGIAALFGSTYARKETVRGVLELPRGQATINAPERGFVQRLAVAEGDVVASGSVLIVVSTDRSDQAGEATQGDMLKSLRDQERSLRARLAAMRASDTFDHSATDAHERSLQANLRAARADRAAASEQLAIAREEFERVGPVAARGFISGAEMQRRKQAIISARQAVSDADGQAGSLLEQVIEQHATSAKRPYSTIQQEGVIKDSLAELQQRRAQYTLSRGYAIRAPISGRITSVQTAVGETADPSRPLLSIVPLHGSLDAVLYVASSGIGFLRPGQKVRIRLDAFPYQSFGIVAGTISSISRTVLRPEEIRTPIHLDEPSYRVVVRLERQQVQAFGRSYDLYPGMALNADILLERRSFAAWFFEPLMALKGRL